MTELIETGFSTILVKLLLPMTIIMQQVLLLLQLIALVTSLPQSQSTDIIENQENVETGLPMAQALVDGENSDLGKL